MCSSIVFVDLTKASDTDDHDILLGKKQILNLSCVDLTQLKEHSHWPSGLSLWLNDTRSDYKAFGHILIIITKIPILILILTVNEMGLFQGRVHAMYVGSRYGYAWRGLENYLSTQSKTNNDSGSGSQKILSTVEFLNALTYSLITLIIND